MRVRNVDVMRAEHSKFGQGQGELECKIGLVRLRVR